MAKRKAVEIIKFLEQELKEKLHISRIILFGSQTTGKATEESDIDIVMVSEDFRNKDIFERVRLLKEAEVATVKKFMVPLDIVLMTPEEFESKTSLIARYSKKGEVVFSR